MMRLLFANLAYRKGLALQACLVALALAAAANLVLPAIGIEPPPEDDFKLVYFFPIFLLFASLFVGIGSLIGDQREYRIVGQVTLPLARVRIAWARVLGPSLIISFGLLAAETLMLAILLLRGTQLEAWRFLFLAFFAGQFLIIVQFPLLIEELRSDREQSAVLRGAVMAGVILIIGFVLLRALSRYVELDPRIAEALQTVARVDPESLISNLTIHAFGWCLVGVNVYLFLRRRTLV